MERSILGWPSDPAGDKPYWGRLLGSTVPIRHSSRGDASGCFPAALVRGPCFPYQCFPSLLSIPAVEGLASQPPAATQAACRVIRNRILERAFQAWYGVGMRIDKHE